jgi:hypothetical protein
MRRGLVFAPAATAAPAAICWAVITALLAAGALVAAVCV